MRFRNCVLLLACCLGSVIAAGTLGAQDLGHKLPGLIGLDAARIPEPGLYVLDRVVLYQADELRDRNGQLIPLPDFQFQALANATGLSYTLKLPRKALFFSFTAAVPVARFNVNVPDRPEASFDRFGLADYFIQPVRLGWRKDRFDLIGSYAIYLPSGLSRLAGGTGVSAGHVTHEFSGGGSIFFNKERTAFITALGSYDLNLRKRGIDITRGDIFEVQGGAGVSRFNRVLEAGLAGHGFWQVRPDRGADLPPALQGLRDRVYGLGPEAAVTFKAIRSQLRVRYEWDFGVRSRPNGNLLVVGFVVLAQHPQPPAKP